MKKFFSLSLLTIFLLSLMVSPGHSQEAADVLKKMIDAQGGRKLLESVKDTTLTGTMEIVMAGMSGSMTLYSKAPDKIRIDFEIMGMVITQAYDGEVAWWVNPQTGAIEELSGDQAEEIKRMAIGDDALLNPEKYGITYTLKGKETIEDKDYFVLEQTFSDGFKMSFYIDSKTYLTYKTAARTMGQMGVEVDSETFLSDYKKIDGMMVPHSIKVFQDGEEFMTMTFTEVSFNTGLEDSFFKMEE